MKELYRYANAYIRKLHWEDFALLKICLIALGVLLGLALPKRIRRPVGFVAVVLFMLTYVPVIGKFLNAGSRQNSIFQ